MSSPRPPRRHRPQREPPRSDEVGTGRAKRTNVRTLSESRCNTLRATRVSRSLRGETLAERKPSVRLDHRPPIVHSQEPDRDALTVVRLTAKLASVHQRLSDGKGPPLRSPEVSIVVGPPFTKIQEPSPTVPDLGRIRCYVNLCNEFDRHRRREASGPEAATSNQRPNAQRQAALELPDRARSGKATSRPEPSVVA